MWNFMGLELANQWLEVTRLWLEQVMTRLWLEKILDDSDSTELWLWIDKNDSGASLPMYGIQKWGEVIVSRIFVFAKCC